MWRLNGAAGEKWRSARVTLETVAGELSRQGARSGGAKT
jgi:hypothetical protein